MKILYIPYRRLNYFILASFLFIVAASLFYSGIILTSKSASAILTMSSTVKNYMTLNVDADGNGKKDIINIEIDENKREYKIEITNDSNKKFILAADSKTGTLGPCLSWWPLQITVADINMDRIPEIITQVAKSTNKFPLYIFRWNGKEYAKILSGDWEGISIADISGDGVPEVISEERIAESGEVYTVYSWIVNSYNKIDCRVNTIARGYDKIQTVTKIIGTPFAEKLLNPKDLEQYFTMEWLDNAKNIDYLKNFSKDIVGLQLQDYLGEDIKLDNNKNEKISIWKLRYLAFRRFGTVVRAENYVAEIETEKVNSSEIIYKINSIKFVGF